MRSNATTHPTHPIITRAAWTLTGLFALMVLLLFSSQDVLAQNAKAVQAERDRLEATAEQAKEAYAVEPTPERLRLMNKSVDVFRRYAQDNQVILQRADLSDGPSKALGTGGPDGFGYTYIDSNEPDGPTYSFIDISATGLLVVKGDDVSSLNSGIFGPVPLGIGSFDFYDQSYASVVPASNGYISIVDFADFGPDLSNDCPIPATPSTPGGTPGARIYPLHDDLDTSAGGQGVWWEFFASCPHPDISGGCDIFHYNAEHFFGTGPFDFEVIFASNGDLLYQYEGNGNGEEGSGSTTGIQNRVNLEPAIGLLYESCNTFGVLPGPGDPGLAVLIKRPVFIDANLAVSKTVDDDTPELGQLITYTITLDYLDVGLPAVGVQVEDALPDGVAYVSHTTTQGSYNPATGIWMAGDLDIGDSETLTITAEVQTSASTTNFAHIVHSNQPDPDVSNNGASVTINPVAADLTLRKQVKDFLIEDGVAHMTFEIKVTNTGPNDVCGVEVGDVGSADLTLVPPIAVSQGTVVPPVIANPPAFVWDVGCLDVGDTATLTVSADGPEGGYFGNEAEVIASGLPDPDSVPGDGEGDDWGTAVGGTRGSPDYVSGRGPGQVISRDGTRFRSNLNVGKTVDNAAPAVGDLITYVVLVTNNGPQNNAGIEVTDHLPDCLINVISTPSQGTYDNWLWDVGKLKVGDTATLTVTAEVGPDCSDTITNTAGVSSANLPDPDDDFFDFDNPLPGDNVASVDISVSAPNARAEATELLANYPNPFNPETVVPFVLAETGAVKLAVYDLLGRQVMLLVNEQLSSGRYEVTFRGDELPTGVYLVRLEAQGVVQTQRITLLK